MRVASFDTVEISMWTIKEELTGIFQNFTKKSLIEIMLSRCRLNFKRIIVGWMVKTAILRVSRFQRINFNRNVEVNMIVER